MAHPSPLDLSSVQSLLYTLTISFPIQVVPNSQSSKTSSHSKAVATQYRSSNCSGSHDLLPSLQQEYLFLLEILSVAGNVSLNTAPPPFVEVLLVNLSERITSGHEANYDKVVEDICELCILIARRILFPGDARFALVSTKRQYPAGGNLTPDLLLGFFNGSQKLVTPLVWVETKTPTVAKSYFGLIERQAFGEGGGGFGMRVPEVGWKSIVFKISTAILLNCNDPSLTEPALGIITDAVTFTTALIQKAETGDIRTLIHPFTPVSQSHHFIRIVMAQLIRFGLHRPREVPATPIPITFKLSEEPETSRNSYLRTSQVTTRVQASNASTASAPFEGALTLFCSSLQLVFGFHPYDTSYAYFLSQVNISSSFHWPTPPALPPKNAPSFLSPQPLLNLKRMICKGRDGQVYRGLLEGASDLNHVVIVKIANSGKEALLKDEASVYADKLVGLSGVPEFGGLFEGDGITALVLEDVGDSIEDGENLSQSEMNSIAATLSNLHSRGLCHGDLARRNITRRESDMFLIGFAETFSHECVGPNCEVLADEIAWLNEEFEY